MFCFVLISLSEPNRASLGQGHRQSYTSKSLKPLGKGPQGRIYQHQQPSWAPQPDSYRNAKEQLMYTHREVNKNVVRESPRALAMAETEYRYRMRGMAK